MNGFFRNKVLPWTVPFALYLILSRTATVSTDYYPWLYTACVIITGGITVYLLSASRILKPHADVFPGVITGLAGIILWIYLSSLGVDRTIAGILPQWLQPEPRHAFDPFTCIATPAGRWLFIAIRIAGLALLVPVVEELFWRGYLMRWIISEDWDKIRIGAFSMGSCLWVTALFTMAHPEWLAAAAYCMLINLLLYWKRDLWNCIVAHGVSNFFLAVYVMTFSAWELW